MRILITSAPVSTHFTSMVPVIWALRARGNEVLVLGQPDIADAAASAGLCAAVVGERFDPLSVMKPALPEGMRPLELVGPCTPAMIASGGLMWGEHAASVLPEYLELARAWRPDLILSEQFEFAGLVIGAELDVPVVMHRWGVDPLSAGTRTAAARVLGELPHPDLILDPCPPSVQIPGIPHGRPVAATPFNGAGEVPDWTMEAVTDRLVCVSLGRQTLALNGIPLLRSIIDAFDGLNGVTALVTVDAGHRELLGAVSSGVRLIDPTPLNLVLPHCAAVIHHGGAQTTLTAIACGIPQLVLPQTMDLAGAPLSATGAAITVADALAQNDSCVLRLALSRLLEEPEHAAAARAIAAEFAALASPDDIAVELEALVAGRMSCVS